MTSTLHVAPSRIRAADLPRVTTGFLRVRKLRSILAALGISIGIASMVAVLGIAQSSKADLLAKLDELGTNLLTISAGQSFGGGDAALPQDATAMVGRLDGVESSAGLSSVDATVRKNRFVNRAETGGIGVYTWDGDVTGVLGVGVTSGRMPVADAHEVAIGAVAAQRLGIREVGERVWIRGRDMLVVGLLGTNELAAGIDRSVLLHPTVAAALDPASTVPTNVYVRARPDSVEQVRSLLSRQASPSAPDEVSIGRPSDALEARAAANDSYTSLFLGLGAVALIVGGVGIANIMVLSVMERRTEIGLRRALGATRRHIAVQFLGEAMTLSALGGIAGVILGGAATAAYATSRGWPIAIPALAIGGGMLASLMIGVIAGFYPAMRAARLEPTDALRGA